MTKDIQPLLDLVTVTMRISSMNAYMNVTLGKRKKKKGRRMLTW